VLTGARKVLGIGQLGDDVNRGDFFKVASLVAGNTKIAVELTASIMGKDPARSPRQGHCCFNV
jgi:hypothetical protein